MPSESAKSSKISTFPTSDDLFIVSESIINIVGRRKMVFLVLRSSSVNNNNDFQLYFKIVKYSIRCHTWSEFFAENSIVTL